MVYLGQAEDEQSSKVFCLSNTLLSEEVGAADKIEFLESDFQIKAVGMPGSEHDDYVATIVGLAK